MEPPTACAVKDTRAIPQRVDVPTSTNVPVIRARKDQSAQTSPAPMCVNVLEAVRVIRTQAVAPSPVKKLMCATKKTLAQRAKNVLSTTTQATTCAFVDRVTCETKRPDIAAMSMSVPSRKTNRFVVSTPFARTCLVATSASARTVLTEIHLSFAKNATAWNVNVNHHINLSETTAFWPVVWTVKNVQPVPNAFRLRAE
jgi:hypothetical protein